MSEQVEQREYFISYNSADAAYAQALSNALEAEGISHHFAGRDLPFGKNIAVWMDDALLGSTRVLALCSPDYFKPEAKYSEAERAATFWADPVGAKARLVPIQIHDCEFTPLYAPLRRMDARGKTPDAAAAFILTELRTEPQQRQQQGLRLANAHPPVFNVARPRLPNFTGRLKDIAAIHETLSQGQNAAVTQAVTGLGGIGKTTLAAEYAHRFGTQGRYGGVWWVNAEGGVLQGLADLAPVWNALKQDPPIPVPEALPDQARAVLSWLGARPIPWLVIYDNVASPDAIQDWMPAGSTRVLITSRFGEFGDLAQTRSLDKWDIETSADFLLSVTKRDDRAGAEALAEALDGLPLALDQAGAYLRNRPILSFEDYAAKVEELIQRERDPGRKGAYPLTVYASLLISFDALSERAQEALQVMSWLAPSGVEEVLLRYASEQVKEFSRTPLGSVLIDQTASSEIYRELSDLSLLQIQFEIRREHVLVVHRVTQAVVRAFQRNTETIAWQRHAILIASNYFPTGIDNFSSYWDIAPSIAEHIKALSDESCPDSDAQCHLARALHDVSIFEFRKGNFDGSMQLARQVLEMIKGELGECSLEFTVVNSSISNRLLELGEVAEAEPGLLCARAYFEDNELTDGPEYEENLFAISRLCHKKRDYSEAESLMLECMDLRRRRSGEHSEEMARYKFGLSVVTVAKSNADQKRDAHQRAIILVQEALKISCELGGIRNLNNVDFLDGLALSESALENYNDGVPDKFDALAIFTSMMGMKHPGYEAKYKELEAYCRGAGVHWGRQEIEEHLVQQINKVEHLMLEWVNKDPEKRQFGPDSFSVKRERGE